MSDRDKTPWGQFEPSKSHLQTERPGARFRYDLQRAGLEKLEVSDEELRLAGKTVIEHLGDDREAAAEVLEMIGLKEYVPGKRPSR